MCYLINHRFRLLFNIVHLILLFYIGLLIFTMSRCGLSTFIKVLISPLG